MAKKKGYIFIENKKLYRAGEFANLRTKLWPKVLVTKI